MWTIEDILDMKKEELRAELEKFGKDVRGLTKVQMQKALYKLVESQNSGVQAEILKLKLEEEEEEREREAEREFELEMESLRMQLEQLRGVTVKDKLGDKQDLFGWGQNSYGLEKSSNTRTGSTNDSAQNVSVPSE